MSKGSQRRPILITREQEDLNWKLFLGQITLEEYRVKRGKLIMEGRWGTKR